MLRAPTADGVRVAAERLAGKVILTPLMEDEFINDAVGGRVLFKAEVLQRGGAFKLRGAYNFMAMVPDADRHKGVVAWSSGNHAQGVAIAARMFGMSATIVMPADAPRIKLEAVRRYGADIVTYDRYSSDREEIGRRLVGETGAALAPSYDHPLIIEGQGTASREAAAQAADLGVSIDQFIYCCGGGGLAAGGALALEIASPETKVFVAEPEGYDDTIRSLAAGKRLSADTSRPTICDAIATPSPGELTFPVLARRAAGGAAVTEAEVAAAMAMAFERLKVVVEPGGAVAFAAVLSGRIDGRGKTTCVTLSGGNVDAGTFTKLLSTRYTGSK
ncbi:MAG: pyridoxal-phosphate dependent enzyme [Alphaproteobacteria bacterium]|nr:pyridoxal-phosphate dependent enzyme [Alphaproteobacteria bacterium]